MYLSKWRNKLVLISKYVCPNCQMYLSKLQKDRTTTQYLLSPNQGGQKYLGCLLFRHMFSNCITFLNSHLDIRPLEHMIWLYSKDSTFSMCRFSLTFLYCAFSNVSSKPLHNRIQSHIGCICLTFLHCAFSNVSSNCLPDRMHSHIGCICLTLQLHYSCFSREHLH